VPRTNPDRGCRAHDGKEGEQKSELLPRAVLPRQQKRHGDHGSQLADRADGEEQAPERGVAFSDIAKDRDQHAKRGRAHRECHDHRRLDVRNDV
jgi:hypothetical protein